MQTALASIAQPRSSADIKSATAAFIGRVALFSAAVDCIYFLFFLAIGSPLLAWINVLSVSMYLASYQLVLGTSALLLGIGLVMVLSASSIFAALSDR